ncbi:MAG TPA: exodeoxyribonuclease V subunit gamma [Aldersonia sp.]
MLKVHTATGTAALADGLADLLAAPLSDPFAGEVVAVPAKGVERWIVQRLALRLGAVDTDGIAANIEFPNPARLVADVLATCSGVDPDDDEWAPARLRWTVLEVIDGCLDESWCAVLHRHLTDTPDRQRSGRRFATAARMVDLFAGYAAQRPAMPLDWAAGRDRDGVGADLEEDTAWQAELWRRVRARVGTPSPAERLDAACAALRADPALVGLPERLSLFGPTRLPTDQLDVLAALGAHRDVHLWLPHPSPTMWDALAEKDVPVRRVDDDSALDVAHPLLAGLGRDVRELQFRLRSRDAQFDRRAEPDRPDTLLGRLQSGIVADLPPADRAVLDGTVAVHACHGAPRQVEALREVLLHLFADDPTLEPRDVLVMCPDVEAYAPLIRAVFGQAAVGQAAVGQAAGRGTAGHPGHELRVRLADRGLRQTNPVLGVVADLLDLADARITASEVLDLAAAEPVRIRFGFSDDDLERMREWTSASGARWGLAQRQRERFGLAAFNQNTFATALDRILLGVAADETEIGWLDRALPLDDVDSTDVDLAGRFAEFLDRLTAAVRDLTGPQPPARWAQVLADALDRLTDLRTADAWQAAQAGREIAAAVEHGADSDLQLADVRAMLAGRLAGRPTRSNFRTGELTVCTMVPMRSVPHRVVCLLGLDDDFFPRKGTPDGDDILGRDPCLGERDPRSEDRQLLLDAIMAATERLVLFYTGADAINGQRRPPAIPLSELLDVLSDLVGPDGMDRVVHRHPLQPFDPRNFDGPRFGAGGPFSFDVAALAGARARQQDPLPPPPLLLHALPAATVEDVALTDLLAFAVNPAQAFARQRLGLRVPEPEEEIADALDVELDSLASWNLGDRMLTARLAGTSEQDFRALEWRRGTLPPFGFGHAALDVVAPMVNRLVDVCAALYTGDRETVDFAVDLGDNRRLTGTVSGLYRLPDGSGTALLRTYYSSLAARHRIRIWVELLAVAAHERERAWQGIATGRGGRSRLSRSTLGAPADPLAHLRAIVDLRDRGLREPLPLAPRTSHRYTALRRDGRSVTVAMTAAQGEWQDRFGDANDRYVQYVYRGAPLWHNLVEAAPAADEAGWFDDPTRFGVLSRRLWEPLLAHESMEQLR